MSGAEEMSDLESSFSRIAIALFEAGSVAATLQRIVDLAQDTISGCDGAGIMVIKRGQATTLAVSQSLVERFDQIQIEAGEGPCLDAAESGTTFYATDLLSDERWPTFAARAIEAGLRSVFALSLTTRHLSALNLYALMPDAFGPTDRAQGVLFATLARLALDSAEERADAGDKLDNLGAALRSRELIGQALGILMER
ncbi:MAG: GAF domain-containing protein, partial [Actinomycetota bacterium]|nr:GAF domain-containing protein [Actinomycetota bacterium]